MKLKKPIRVLSVFGTRPEAVKLAPVIMALKSTSGIQSIVCVTGQHREMLDQVLRVFNIHPDVDLNLMKPSQSLAELTASVFTQLDPVLQQLMPDWVLVQGDTTTVMAASLCAFYRNIKVGHVEAGLRTHDKFQPFPEEINRRIASVIADLHFAPTELNRQNLLGEGIVDDDIVVTGNPVIDALKRISSQPEPESIVELAKNLEIGAYGNHRMVLVTAHRRENFGEPIRNICKAILELANRYHGEVKFVYPVHLNPNVKDVVYHALGQHPDITLLPPQDYLDLVHLIKNAYLVMTDSGGIQEEAPGLGKPVLVLRDVTERPEGVASGNLKLVGTEVDRIVQAAASLLDDQQMYQSMSKAVNPFGDGHAAEYICNALIERACRQES